MQGTLNYKATNNVQQLRKILYLYSMKIFICFEASIYIHIPRFHCIPKGMFLKIISAGFKITYLMTTQSPFTTVKRNISFIKKNCI